MKNNQILAISLGCLVLMLVFCGCGRGQQVLYLESEVSENIENTDRIASDVQSDSMENEEETAEENSAVENIAAENIAAEETEVGEVSEIIYVQVVGAVNQPGVYSFEKDARVYEAVQSAGGLTEDAVIESVNQAKKLSDGEMVKVYTQDEWQVLESKTMLESEDINNYVNQDNLPSDQDGPTESSDKIDINTANKAQLQSISGIGEKRAESIIAYREKNGPFSKISDIKKVSGIKDGLFDQIKDQISVE